MSLHRLTHNNLRANGHMGKFRDVHRMEADQEDLMGWEGPVDRAPAKRTSSIPEPLN